MKLNVLLYATTVLLLAACGGSNDDDEDTVVPTVPNLVGPVVAEPGTQDPVSVGTDQNRPITNPFNGFMLSEIRTLRAVSYTHLTLPTKA